ncbi:MAG: A/G-specific adenine glycosylase [Candidatus Andersenbacteria bacterium]
MSLPFDAPIRHNPRASFEVPYRKTVRWTYDNYAYINNLMTLALSPKAQQGFQRKIKKFFAAHSRDLPWRRTDDPYHILVSEVMLQQTQVDRVIPKYQAFIAQFPTVATLANTSLRQVVSCWQGLGYNRRALALQKTAQVVQYSWQGKVPPTISDLETLPGIGPYTAKAIATFAFNQPHVLIETNIRTVFIHEFFAEDSLVADSHILPLITQTLDYKHPREWYWALMDYGSWVKKHHHNPSRRSHHYHKQSTFKNSNRQIRGLLIKTLTTNPPLTLPTLFKLLPHEPERVVHSLQQLADEGLIKKKGKKYLIE